ncbi:hypothetical protein EDD85DRAFT_265547 [Armillaria nabsnona]|nr:hypothetical protein EDD85DRAFT_265547 [Armillaria nabsnona]
MRITATNKIANSNGTQTPVRGRGKAGPFLEPKALPKDRIPRKTVSSKCPRTQFQSEADSLANAINVALGNGTSPNKGDEGLSPADGEPVDALTRKSDGAHMDDADGEVNTTGHKHALAKKDGGYESSDLSSAPSDDDQDTDREKGKKKKADSEEEEEEEEEEAPKLDASGDESPALSYTKEAKRARCKRARAKRGKKAVLSSKARQEEQNRIRAAQHTMMTSLQPALKSTLIEAPAILGHKRESHAAVKKRRIAQQINDSLHLLYLVPKGEKHPFEELGKTNPICSTVLCDKPISAAMTGQLVYMRNACDHWKQIKLKGGETANNAGESSKKHEMTSIKKLIYHWKCVPASTKHFLQTAELLCHESVPDKTYAAVVKELRATPEVTRGKRVVIVKAKKGKATATA